MHSRLFEVFEATTILLRALIYLSGFKYLKILLRIHGLILDLCLENGCVWRSGLPNVFRSLKICEIL